MADDVVVTRDGRRLRGVVSRVDGKIVVKMKLGAIKLDPSEVLRIEPVGDALAELKARTAKLEEDDHAGRLTLAKWAVDRRLYVQAVALARPIAKAGSGAEGVHRTGARSLIATALLTRHLEHGVALDDAARKELARYASATKAVIAERYRTRSGAVAGKLMAAEPLTVRQCSKIYDDLRRRLWVTVSSPSFPKSERTGRAARRAVRLHDRLKLLYEATTTAPYLVLEHADALRSLTRLEDLALDLGVALPASPAHEAALTVAGKPLDRRALMVALKNDGKLRRMIAANKRFEGPSDAERALVTRINTYRHMLLLEPLAWERRLIQAAEGHTRSMLQLGFFSHYGKLRGHREPKDRVARTGYPWRLVGEVLARKSEDPDAVFRAFLDSPAHHNALILRRFREVGARKIKDYWTVKMAVRR